jgi:glycosyltransferase involved in cell wall biosynthesis
MSSVSVVIPCYNYGNFLRDAVHSVLTGQDGVDVRALVIDAASTDNSVEIAKAIAEEDPGSRRRSTGSTGAISPPTTRAWSAAIRRDGFGLVRGLRECVDRCQAVVMASARGQDAWVFSRHAPGII